MRLAFLLLGIGVSIFAQVPQTETPAIQKAKTEIERIGALVAEGALPKVRLEEAQRALLNAQDDAVLDQILYGSVTVQELTEEQGNAMLAAARRLLTRSQEKWDGARALVDQGVAPRKTLDLLAEDVERAQKTVQLAESRQKLLVELVEMARAEQDNAEDAVDPLQPFPTNAVAFRYDGAGNFDSNRLKVIDWEFTRVFEHPLPVSAQGMTAVHRALGYDHRGRVDVALSPDQPEGIWLRRYLEREKIPYFAFRRSVPGKATAPHIHIGPPSLRLRSAD